MTGQSNGSPINVQVMGCYWRRDDNLLLKIVHEGLDENAGKTEGEQLDECICTVQSFGTHKPYIWLVGTN